MSDLITAAAIQAFLLRDPNTIVYVRDLNSVITLLAKLVPFNAYNLYVGILKESSNPATSGPLIVGGKYVIEDFVADDDFVNVGAASNASGIKFTATGTTPTDWSNGSTLLYNYAPTSDELWNGMGTLTFDRTSIGSYTVTSPDPIFLNTKTSIVVTPNVINAEILAYRSDDYTLVIYTYYTDDFTAAILQDDILSKSLCEIRIYNT